ncbi:methyltransferase domain-containing protein [Palleronia aestuarii]|nr:methyltransferase domain-containing protein [Palleronia aestuarii]
MAHPPKLTDRSALRHHRARARGEALFLHEIAADQLEERLNEVNRSFTAPAIVTGQPDFWAARHPSARIVEDKDVLDLEPGAHDLVIHAMALHWADDPVGQLVQCRHALKPDGLCLVVCFGARSLAELRAVLGQAEARITGGLSPRVAPLPELRDLGGLLQRAGFALPVADSDVLTVSYADATALMRELRAMGEGNALAARDRRPPPRALFAEAARLYAAEFPMNGEPRRIRATAELVYLSGWAPDESQQKPLRPGSASARLADALGTSETPLPTRSGD